MSNTNIIKVIPAGEEMTIIGEIFIAGDRHWAPVSYKS